jgi:hypothetical protein
MAAVPTKYTNFEGSRGLRASEREALGASRCVRGLFIRRPLCFDQANPNQPFQQGRLDVTGDRCFPLGGRNAQGSAQAVGPPQAD